MGVDTGKTGGGKHPAHSGEKNAYGGWAAVPALLGAGVPPCPECGAPPAWHLWPLAAPLPAARFISRRSKRTRRPGPARPSESPYDHTPTEGRE